MNTEMPTKIEKFDPKNPEAWEELPYRVVSEMRRENSALHAEYGTELKKWRKWRAKETRKKMQLPNPALKDENSPSTRREIELMTTLGRALEKEGFTVKWVTGLFDDDYEVHPSWAKYAVLYKDGKRVGDYHAWRPHSGWHYRPVGWIIRTNRGVGNPNARWGGAREEKRLKKLESAVKYIKDTAVPGLDYEPEINKLKKQIESLRIKASNLGTSISRAKNGMSTWQSNDGLLFKILEMHRTGDRRGLEDALNERWDLINRLESERTVLLDQVSDITMNQLNPLLERAAKDLPEFYSQERN